MLHLSALLYIYIYPMEFIPLILIKAASHSVLAPLVMVVDIGPEVLDT